MLTPRITSFTLREQSKRYWIPLRRGRMTSIVAIEIHDSRAIAKLRAASRAAAETLAFVGSRIRSGISTAQIDAWVREDTARQGGKPSQLGYHGFPASVCTSRNAVVCHGIPRHEDVLAPGDIVNVDVTTMLNGYHGDTSATFVVGGHETATPEALHVVDVARRCRDAAARPPPMARGSGGSVRTRRPCRSALNRRPAQWPRPRTPRAAGCGPVGPARRWSCPARRRRRSPGPG